LGGWLAHSIVFHWIYIAAVRYGGANPGVGVVAVVGLALYPALFVGLFGWGWSRLDRTRWWAPLAGAALWSALDHARSFVLTGFPWALLGYTQHENPLLLALAPWTGVYGLSFVTAGVGLSLGCAFSAWRSAARSPKPAVLVAVTLLAVAHAGGAVSYLGHNEASGPIVRVGILQGNIDQSRKWNPDAASRTLAVYEELTRRAVKKGAQVVLWPETAAPGFPEPIPPGLDHNPLRERLHALADETGSYVVVGALGGDPFAPYDSAFVFAPGSEQLQRYDKAHLVPFGEYLPMRALIGTFVNAIARGSANTDVRVGAGPASLSLGELASVGTPICYELLFPDLVRRFRVEGSELLLAMTNDAWYGRSGAPYQFLAMSAFRSAEGRVWAARAANTGVSAVIDDRGRVRERTAIFERDLLVADLPRRERGAGDVSFYARHGDLFVWACWLVAALAIGLWGRRREGQA
jgi:apolipoprotein N-acyltransferase